MASGGVINACDGSHPRKWTTHNRRTTMNRNERSLNRRFTTKVDKKQYCTYISIPIEPYHVFTSSSPYDTMQGVMDGLTSRFKKVSSSVKSNSNKMASDER